jgi:ABC-2 type transport system ATP-binding protein
LLSWLRVDRTVLEASDLAKSFSGSPLFAGLSFRAGTGLTAITGPNGSGKTTLLKILADLLRPTAGRVRVRRDGVELAGEQRRRAIGWCGPDLDFYGDFTARENLSFFRRLAGLPDTGGPGDLLERVGLSESSGRVVREYSTGMKQRLRIAFALLTEPPVVVWDEPYAALDADGRRRVASLVEERRAVGPVILASNDAGDFPRPEQVIELGRRP